MTDGPDYYRLLNALTGAFSSQADTMDALEAVGCLRSVLVEREADLVTRATEEGHDWLDIAIALRRDPDVVRMMHRSAIND